MHIPDYITEQIERRLGGRFRLRWSDVEHVYRYEQKVRRGIAEGFAPIKFKSERHRKQVWENQVCANDGYVLVLKIAAGTTVECQHCGGDIKVPAFKVAQSKCDFCAMQGKNSVFNGGFFPLSDSLLDYFDKYDPDRGGSQRVMDENTLAVLKAEHEQMYPIVSTADAVYREEYNKLVGVPQTGYSGATKMWQDAPESKKTWKGEKL